MIYQRSEGALYLSVPMLLESCHKQLSPLRVNNRNYEMLWELDVWWGANFAFTYEKELVRLNRQDREAGNVNVRTFFV